MISLPAKYLLDILEEHGMDPLLVFACVIEHEILIHDTFIGFDIFRYLQVLLALYGFTLVDALPCFKKMFYATPFDGFRGITKTRNTSVSGVKIFNLKLSSSRKSEVMEEYMNTCKENNFRSPCASIIQVVYYRGEKERKRDESESYRMHKIYTHAQDCVLCCRELLTGDNNVLSVVEIPNILQLVQKVYIDWDLLSSNICYLDHLNNVEKLDVCRRLAEKTPSVICSILISLGMISSMDIVEVVVKEGTRWVEEKKAFKISMHFIFQIIGTRKQIHIMWDKILHYIRLQSPMLYSVLRGEVKGITSDCAKDIGLLLPLVGVDLHLVDNAEQGLAMAFSRKNISDKPSRLMRILHVQGGIDYMNEIPCKTLWNASLPITSDVIPLR
jgi:hypothetical protein